MWVCDGDDGGRLCGSVCGNVCGIGMFMTKGMVGFGIDVRRRKRKSRRKDIGSSYRCVSSVVRVYCFYYVNNQRWQSTMAINDGVADTGSRWAKG